MTSQPSTPQAGFSRRTSARPGPKGRQVDHAARATVETLLETGAHPGWRQRDQLIENLHVLQDHFGALGAPHLVALADLMGLSQAEVYEVATFYAHFDAQKDDTPPPPLTVRICEGVSCALEGGIAIAEALQKALGARIHILKAPCMGLCDAAPAAAIGPARIGHIDAKGLGANLESVLERGVVPGAPSPEGTERLAACRAHGGYDVLHRLQAGEMSRTAALDALAASGLCGLGGAGFPVARKWRFLDGKGKPRAVVVNADEGEPGTFKDRHIFETRPHRVIEGALIAAHVVEAEDVYIYLRDEYPHIRNLLVEELDAVRAAGLNGTTRLHLRRGAGAYICGEETALLESIEGKRGLPRNRPPFPAESGLFGRPTLINNAETLYWVSEILARGADWYQGEGRPHFFSVSGRVAKPGVVLAPAGTSVLQLIHDHAGGMAPGHTFKGFLPGGASGGIMPASLGDEPLDFGTMEQHGGFIGSSAVVILSDKDNIKAVARNLLHFFADESCGQCTPCRAGCEKMLTLLDQPKANRTLINELATVMADASICGLGQAAPNPVLTAFRFFEDDMS